MARETDRKPRGEESEFDEDVVFINRSSKTTKGGRRMSFSAFICVGRYFFNLSSVMLAFC